MVKDLKSRPLEVREQAKEVLELLVIQTFNDSMRIVSKTAPGKYLSKLKSQREYGAPYSIGEY